MFTAQDVMALRQSTGAGMMDCKKALTACEGDKEKAAEWLREHGALAAAKKESRIAAEGIVDSYIHMGGKIGVLLEVNCESDFVARGEGFKELVHDIAMQIAATNPQYVAIADVPSEVTQKEMEALKAQIANEGKVVKPEILDKMITGRIAKFYKQICLLEQEFVKDNSLTIQQLVTNSIAKIGEKITVRRFVRYEMGEGLEKRVENLQEAVAEQLAKTKADVAKQSN